MLPTKIKYLPLSVKTFNMLCYYKSNSTIETTRNVFKYTDLEGNSMNTLG